VSHKPKTGTSSRRWLVVVCAAAACFHVCLSAKGLPPPSPAFERSHAMDRHMNRFGTEGLFPGHRPRFRRLEPDRELLALEHQLRERNLLDDPQILRWLGIANCGTQHGRAFAVERLRQALQVYEVQAMRDPDPYRPYGPLSLLCQGDLHLMDQMDSVPWCEWTDAFLTGGFIAGTQGGGKSRAIIFLCRQLVKAVPPRRVFIIDPKGELATYADYLHAVAIDGSQIALDLAPPPGLDYRTWLRQLMPQLGATIGVIYGVEILEEAAELALAQLMAYRRQAPRPAELSLQDIYVALPFVQAASRGRRVGYLEAVQTGLKRILSGSGTLFTCRCGVPLQDLFSRNIILDLRHITDEFTSRWLAQYLLYWSFQEARSRPPTTCLQTLIVIDDAQRYISRRAWSADAAEAPTPLAHILAVLRSSGTGLLVASQLPAAVDPSVLALSNVLLVVGGVHGLEHQQVMARMMNLNREQQAALGKLQTREAVGVYTRGAYREPVHGWIPEVPDPIGGRT